MADAPVFRYCNTDLDLVATVALDELAAALQESGVWPLHVTHEPDNLWYSILETDNCDHTEPDSNIAEMLTAIDSLPDPVAQTWNACTKREFNIGYECGDEPWAFNQGLSNETLRRVAECGATLSVTLYPFRSDESSQRDNQ